MDRRGILIVVGLLAMAVVIAVFATRPATPAASPAPSAALSLEASPSANTGESASASAEPSPTPTPAEAAGPPEIAWEPIDGFQADAAVNGMAFVDGRWLALGAIGRVPAIWFSDDGESWTQSDVQSTLEADEAGIATDVVAVDGALVATGVWGVIPSDQAARVVWRSTDGGASWSEERSGEVSPFTLTAITAGGPGVVGAGGDYQGTTPFDSWITLSSDGVSWTRVDAESLAGSQVLALVALGDRLIAAGARFTESDTVPAAWVSDDAGATWRHVEPGAIDDGRFGLITDLAIHDNQVVAVGRSANRPDAMTADQLPTAWTSVNGEAWEPIELGEVGGVAAVTTIDAGLVAVGNLINVELGPREPPSVWTSADGIGWAASQIVEDALYLADVAGDGTIVIAGGFCRTEPCASRLWRGKVVEGN